MSVQVAPVRIAVVGLNHGYSLAQAIASCESAQLVGLCTRNPSHHQHQIDALGAPVFVDLEQLLAATSPDGVAIAAPTDQLVPMAKACLARDISILVEKPLGVSVADVLELQRAAAGTRAQVAVGYYRRLSRQVGVLRELLNSGLIGEVSGVSCKWMIQKPPDYFKGWKAVRERGGGCLMINFIHDFDLLQSLLGPIEAVTALQGGARRDDLEHFMVITLRFAGGQLASAMLSDQSPSPYSYENTVATATEFPRYAVDSHHFFGTRGSLAFPSFTVYSCPSPHSHWRTPLAVSVASHINETLDDPIALEIESFVAVLRGNSPPHATIDDAIRNLAVVEAIRRSLESGRTEAVHPAV